MFLRRRRKRAAVPGGPAGPPQPSIEELERRAASLLVETDDALKTSAQELGFAKAQFGDAATAEFEAALATAQQNLDEAFALKQQLDDADARLRGGRPRLERAHHRALRGVEHPARREGRRLRRAAQARAERPRGARTRAGGAGEGRGIPRSGRRRSCSSCSRPTRPRRSRPSSTTPRRRGSAWRSPTSSSPPRRPRIGAGDGGEAAVGIRAAEEAVGQATLLEDAIEKLATDLAAGERNATALIAELEQDIAAASALPDADGRIAGVIAATRQQLDAARTQLTGTARRPLAALQSLEAANAQIDSLVQGVRDAAAQAQRARQMVGQVDDAGAGAGVGRRGLHHRAPRCGRRRGPHAPGRGRRLARPGAAAAGRRPAAGAAAGAARRSARRAGDPARAERRRRLRRRRHGRHVRRRAGRRSVAAAACSAPCSAASCSTPC